MPSVYVLPDQRLVECRHAEAILPAALRARIPVAHACGGRASCSTCRVVVIEGRTACSERTPKEWVIAERLGFSPEFRLACQTTISADVTVRRLVLDDDDMELADIRPHVARRRTPAPVHWALGGLVNRRSRARSIGDEMHVAVLFSDIRGFTSFSEALLPYDVIHELQRHLRMVQRAVEHHGGVVTSYMGDGVMALFGVRDRRSPSLHAVQAAQEMLAQTDTRRQSLAQLYGRSFDLNVGLHYGAAIVGTLGAAPSSVTAIGDTVNMASRIEQANKEHGTRFLMSAATLAEVSDDVIVGRTFRCSLPGKAGEHTLIEVLGTCPS
ncbi:MAG TPA: adenylate/guanylate cyclase domain-containing protein [Desertimonas sp.]|nr:adenylate/guanylate cyclase domain-containing protein [Desertimonas sp.]